MSDGYNIQYLTQEQIDKTKWDTCINNAGNGLVYGYSFYLDSMAKHWDALVLNDYETIMPLTWNKKYGICYLYQPFLTAQLGVFGIVNADMLSVFLKAIPQKFRYWDFYLNHGNVFALKDYELYERSNFVLDLSKPYEDLFKSYRDNIKRNIKKAYQSGCYVQKGFGPEKVIEIALEQMQLHTKTKPGDFMGFQKVYQHLHSTGQAITYGIFSSRNDLLASCIFFFSHRRAYYILVGNHPNGKTAGASHALIDAFIKDHSDKNLLLDFEGSDIRNLAFFYSGFGAVEEKFAGIRLNRLPFYLKPFKR